LRAAPAIGALVAALMHRHRRVVVDKTQGIHRPNERLAVRIANFRAMFYTDYRYQCDIKHYDKR
jgi:hypothetical protein